MTRTPVTDGDFYLIEQTLEPSGRELLSRTREFMEKSVQPVINQYWTREEFPYDLVVPGLRQLGIAGQAYTGYGCPGGGNLLDGMIAMELARVDSSIATFFGVHSGLAMGSIYLCGSEEQKQRWLPEMARLEKIGAFGLTEPDVGSGVAGGLTTTARRDGAEWVLDGQKKWIGNATFADYVIIWARSLEDQQVKGFVVEKGTPGFSPVKMHDKIALRVVQNAHITLDGVRVPESHRLPGANSFKDTAKVLRMTRAGGGSGGPRAAPGARTTRRSPTPASASSSAGRSPVSSWSRTCWCGCWPTSPPRPACAPGWPRCSRTAWPRTTTRRSPRRSARCGCARRSAGPASCWAGTASCWRTRWAGSWPTPRRSTPTRAPARSTP